MATLRESMKIAKTEPNSERSMKLMSAIMSGKADAMAAQEGIDLTVFKKAVSDAQVSPAVAAGNMVTQGVTTLLKGPGEVLKQAGELATGAAPAVAEGVKAVGESIDPSMRPQLQAEEAQRDAQSAATVEKEKSVNQKLNKTGFVPPSDSTIEEREEAVGAIKNINVPPSQQFQTGMGKQGVETMLGIGKLGAEAMGAGLSAVTGKKFTGVDEGAEQTMREGLKGETFTENAGKFTESMLEFAAPSMALGKGLTALKTLAPIPKWYGRLLTASGEGAIAGGVTAAQEGKFDESAALNSTIGFAAPIVLGLGDDAIKGIKGLFSKGPQGIERKALQMGIPEKYANVLGEMDDVERVVAQDYLQQGVKKLNNQGTQNVFEYASRDIDDFIKQGQTKLDDLGAQVGKAKEGLKTVTISDDVLRNSSGKIDDVLTKYNIKQTKGGLDFANSELADASKAQEQISKVYKAIQKGKNLNARDLEAITGQIDQATGLLKSSGIKTGDPAVKALSETKSIVNGILGESDEAFGAANQEFAQFKRTFDQVKNAAQVPIGKGKYAYNGDQILRRSLGVADTKPVEAMKAMEELSSRYPDLPKISSQELAKRSYIADFAEKFTNTAPPQGLQSSVEAASDILPHGGKIKALQGALQFVAPSRPIENNAVKLINLLGDAKLFKDGSAKLTPEAVGALKELLRAVHPTKRAIQVGAKGLGQKDEATSK